MNRFRTLTADEIECRIAMVKNTGVSVLLYKTARTDADMLDEAFGAEYWENDFKLIDGVLYGGIGVDYNKTGEGLVWKWDAGTESNTEAEKGRASDAFKRAGFKHGIGRELYTAPFIWIPFAKLKNVREGKVYDSFTVAEIGYSDARKIDYLVITNQAGDVVFQMGAPKENVILCRDCGRPITDAKRRDGTVWSKEEIAQYSLLAFSRELCASCGKKAEKAKHEAELYASREDGE